MPISLLQVRFPNVEQPVTGLVDGGLGLLQDDVLNKWLRDAILRLHVKG